MTRPWIALSLLLGACNPVATPAETSAPLNIIHIDPCVLLDNCAYTPQPRNQCRIVSGAWQGGTLPVTFGPGAQPAGSLSYGQNCVETGHLGRDGTTYVDLDNPRVWSEIQLHGVHTKTAGYQKEEILAQGFGWSNRYFDIINTSNAGDLLARPVGDGDWAPPSYLTLLDAGLQLSYGKLTTQLYEADGVGQQQMAAFPVTLSLSSDVLLIPVETVVMTSPSYGPGSQLDGGDSAALWDRFEDPENVWRDISGGEQQSVYRETRRRVETSSKDGIGRYDGLMVPDDVWTQCGVQFRQVAYNELPTDDRHVLPARVGDWANVADEIPFDENRDAYQASGRHQEGVPWVMFMRVCSFRESLVEGYASDRGYACVATDSYNRPDTTLAHELGHILGLNDAYDYHSYTCAFPSPNLMCLNGPQLTVDQCPRVRSIARSIVDNLKRSGRYPF